MAPKSETIIVVEDAGPPEHARIHFADARTIVANERTAAISIDMLGHFVDSGRRDGLGRRIFVRG
jgi:hypothetical protein